MSPGPSASATALPIRVVTQGGSGKYVTIVQSVRGRKVYTIRALSSVAQRAPSGETVATLEQPHVTFVDRGGGSTIADAPKAQVTERDKSVVMTGGVRATTSQGNVLTCDTLTYNGATEKLRGEGHVRLSSPNGFELAGDHLAGDVRLQDVKITSGASR
jgi:LPS export ABC transporter protein LptC